MSDLNYIFSNRHYGFCNSLWIWQLCYELSIINNMKVAIYRDHFPEARHFNFPNTIILDKIPNELVLVNSNEIEKNNFILPKKNIQLSCGWKFNTKFQNCNKTQPVSRIKFYDDELNLKIENLLKNKIGIHYRRGDFNNYKHSKYIPDSFFIEKCNFYKNKIFYLATDATMKEEKIFDKYNIIRYNEFFDIKYDHVNCHVKTNLNKLKNINDDLIKIKCIDLFALSRCEKIIGCHTSTFSITASWMGNNKEMITGS